MEDELKLTDLPSIRRRFRLAMNGVASRSMREKGVDYKLNWGVALPELKAMAAEIGPNAGLASELWKENVRECKILATMVMPPSEMQPDMIELWGEQIPTCEVAETLAFYLLSRVEGIHEIALKWMAGSDEMRQHCAYHILGRLFSSGDPFDMREANEFLDQAMAALPGASAGLRRAVNNALMRYSLIDELHEQMVDRCLQHAH